MSEKQIERLYWDACTFIDWIQEWKGSREFIDPVIAAGEQGEIQIVTSMVSYVEAHRKSYQQNEQYDRTRVDGIFDYDFVERVVVDIRIAERARWLVQQRIITNFDAVHLATAMEYPTECLVTRDGGLLESQCIAQGINIVTPEQYFKDYFPAALKQEKISA